jgi:hypothetical protein
MSRFKIWFENYEKVVKSLDHPDCYARKVKDIEEETGLTRDEILKVIKDKPVNLFSHKGIEYAGLKSRKKAYEADKKRGINPWEPNYKGDVYRAKILKHKPRFQ